MIALTLALYVTLYLALIVAYIGVLKYMAEKPERRAASATRATGRPRQRRISRRAWWPRHAMN